MAKINRTVLMSDARYFGDEDAINPYMDNTVMVDKAKAELEHASIRQALEDAGIKVVQVPSPDNCQDGVYTANWALVRGDVAVLSSLPNKRQPEEAYAIQTLSQLGKRIIQVPGGLRFSGQGDALPCGNYLFVGSTYRTDVGVHDFLGDTLGYKVVGLETIPARDAQGNPITNAITGWPDSYFYDIDLALSVITPDLIAWCPEAFTPESQEKIRELHIDKIEVSVDEAVKSLACNLISTGETVIMSAHAPQLKAAIEAKGLKTITPEISELAKGGGYIRCTALTIDND